MSTITRTIRKWRYIFIAPGLIWYTLFMVYPIYYVINLSLHLYKGPRQKHLFIGIQNYLSLYADHEFLQAFTNTFVFVFVVVIIVTPVALVIASVLSRVRRFQGFFRSIYYLPSVVGVVAIGIIWQWVFVPRFGLLDNFFRMIRLSPLNWLRDPKIALMCIAVVKIWMRIGFNIVVYLAGLLSIPQQYYDAAEVDGAGTIRKFFSITIPLVLPITTLMIILNTIDSLQVVGEIFMLTKGGPAGSTTTAGFLMYMTAFQFNRMGKASAIALILLLVILVVTILQRKLLESKTIEY